MRLSNPLEVASNSPPSRLSKSMSNRPAVFGNGKTRMITIHTQNIDGTWSLYKELGQHHSNDDQLHASASPRSGSIILPHNRDLSNPFGTMDVPQNPHSNVDVFIDGLDLTFYNPPEPLSSVPGPDSFAMPLNSSALPPSVEGLWAPSVGLGNLFQAPVQGVPDVFGLPSNVSPWSPEPNYRNLLQFLPSNEADDFLDAHSTCPTRCKMKVDSNIPLGASLVNRMHRTSSPLDIASRRQNHVGLFLEEVQNSLASSRTTLSGLEVIPLNGQGFLDSLRNLACNQIYRQKARNAETVDSPSDILESELRFNRLLLCSVIDGSSDTHKIPVGSILAHLGRCIDITWLLTMLLNKITGPTGTMLVERFFRHAIEAKDKNAVESILKTRMIDINSISCTHDGLQYTPIERAASLQSVQIVELLLEMNADANKSFSADPSSAGALANLILSIPEGPRIEEQLKDLVAKLINRGSHVHPTILHRVLYDIKDPDLVHSLASSLAQRNHSAIFDGGLIRMMELLPDVGMTGIMSRCFNACEQNDCRKCLNKYSNKIDWALIKAASHGHLKLFKTLREKHTPFHSYQLLSAAIRGRNNLIVENVLSMEPDLDGPTHSIDNGDWKLRNGSDYDATTSFAEAIKAENRGLMNRIISAGALSSLNKGHRFQPALAAAVEIVDIDLVRMLIDQCQQPEPNQMTRALLVAIEQDPIQEIIIRELLQAGVNVSTGFRQTPTPLFAAMIRRNRYLVHTLLDSDPYNFEGACTHHWKGRVTSVLLEALHWGDPSILDSVRRTFPLARIRGRIDLYELVRNNDEKMLSGLNADGILEEDALLGGLRAAVGANNTRMVNVLLELVARVDGLTITEAVEAKSGDLLKIILTHIHDKPQCVPRGFGTQALTRAIQHGSSGRICCDILLDSGFVDVDCLIWRSIYSNSQAGDYMSPLGFAIQQCENDQSSGLSAIKRLFKAKADPNRIAKCIGGSVFNLCPVITHTPLLLAIETKNYELVKFLIENGANHDTAAINGYKRTPLQKAAEAPSLAIVQLLLEKRADVNEAPAHRSGGTAIQMAAISGDVSVACELLCHGAKLDSPPPSTVNGRWPLEGAAEHGHGEMIKFLWDAAKEQRVVFDQAMCSRAIELARGNGHPGCVESIRSLQRESDSVSLLRLQ